MELDGGGDKRAQGRSSVSYRLAQIVSQRHGGDRQEPATSGVPFSADHNAVSLLTARCRRSAQVLLQG